MLNVENHYDDEEECFLVFVRYGHSLVTECYQTRHPFVHITQAQVGGGGGGGGLRSRLRKQMQRKYENKYKAMCE